MSAKSAVIAIILTILEKLLNAAQLIRRGVQNVLGNRGAPIHSEVRRAILEQIKSGIISDASGRQFPYGKVIVWLHPPARAMRNAFEASFVRNNSLKTEIEGILKDAAVRLPDPFEIKVELYQSLAFNPADSSPHPLFQLDFVKPAPLIKIEAPETTLVISKGSAEHPAYRLRKERILIGRSQDVLDREGRLVRKNDVAFLDNGEAINSTVSRAHARIWFDFEQNEFFIMDEGSGCGTLIVREEHPIEVPAGNPCGIRLRSGDAIYCGQAGLLFDLQSLLGHRAPDDA
jgi:hypothetical protein